MSKLFDALKVELAFTHDESVTVEVSSQTEEDRDVHRVRPFGPKGTTLYEVRVEVFPDRYELFDSRDSLINSGHCLMDLMDFVSSELRL